MSVYEVRSHFLNDHARLRGKVAVLRSLALGVLRGDAELSSALRLKGQDLQDHLQRHMSWEEEKLLPALDRSSPLAGDTAIALRREHATQRGRLADSLNSLEDIGYPPKELAQSIMDLIAWIESDMVSEEEAVLDFLGASGQEFDEIKE